MSNSFLKLMASRLGTTELPEPSNINDNNQDMATRLSASGGYVQQERMIRDKRKTLDKATLYSYQGAKVKKINEEKTCRALINPNQIKQNYDDKVISVGFEWQYKPGDVFEWCNTGTYWLVYLQDLTELAYFRGDIRKCSHIVEWQDENKQSFSTYIALEGPPEKVIKSTNIQGANLDIPNYNINFMVPYKEETLKFFTRYQKFYLKGNNVCWRVEAVNSVGTPGIIKVSALEYYSNEFQDDIENGQAGVIDTRPIIPANSNLLDILGETFIKPRREYDYYIDVPSTKSIWTVNNRAPVELIPYKDDNQQAHVKLKWNSNYSGQFDLECNSDGVIHKKTIVVESLF